MTKDELLTLRYKVINIWPDMSNYGHYQGQVITMAKLKDGGIGWPTNNVTFYPAHFDNFPHLFEPLPWWKERKVEDMPEYVKSIKQEYDYGLKVGEIIKVKEWLRISKTMYVIQGPNREYHPDCLIPATEADYNTYLQTTNQLNNGQ